MRLACVWHPYRRGEGVRPVNHVTRIAGPGAGQAEGTTPQARNASTAGRAPPRSKGTRVSPVPSLGGGGEEEDDKGAHGEELALRAGASRRERVGGNGTPPHERERGAG